MHSCHDSSNQFPIMLRHLLSNANDTASGTSTRIARRLALLVSALAEIIRAAVDNDGPTEHALGANQLNLLVGDGALGVALGVRLEVAEVADVAFAVRGGAVGFGERVDWIAGERGGSCQPGTRPLNDLG